MAEHIAKLLERKKVPDHNQKKTHQRKDSVTVLGMVCEKGPERVEVPREQESTLQHRRNRKIMRVFQTRERSGRSQT